MHSYVRLKYKRTKCLVNIQNQTLHFKYIISVFLLTMTVCQTMKIPISKSREENKF